MIASETFVIVLTVLLGISLFFWWKNRAALLFHLHQVEKELVAARTQLEVKEKQWSEFDLKQQFSSVAREVMEERATHFNQHQETQLRHILEPVQQQISQFRNELDTRLKYDAGDRISLREQIRQMMELNKTLSDQANSLTSALRGQNKMQGNWGEMILESILEYAGLQKNMQYFVQERHTNTEGKIIQPDVIVRYPDQRAIVIDAKVSLLHYEQSCNAPLPTEKEEALKNLVRSMKSHADGLFLRSYQDIGDSLDFVMMFVPVEGAYIAAMQTDPSLWQYTYNKKVLLISPTNLVAAMKLIYDVWQRDAIHTNAMEIAERAGKMYDKLAGFTETYARVGDQLEKAYQSWDLAKKQLHTGKGNLLSQAEQMRLLGIKNTKRIAEEGDQE